MKMFETGWRRKWVSVATIGALAAALIVPASAEPATARAGVSTNQQGTVMDVSAKKRHRHYRGRNNAAALAAFGVIAGTIANIAAQERRERYYEDRYYGYGYAPGYYYDDYPGYYVAPAPVYRAPRYYRTQRPLVAPRYVQGPRFHAQRVHGPRRIARPVAQRRHRH